MDESKVISSNDLVNFKKLHLSRAKLKATARTSALLAGFAMVPLVEIELKNEESNPVPTELLIAFGVCTVLLVSVHMLALMISTCILPHLEAVLASAQDSLEENHYNNSAHDKMSKFIEMSWALSNVIGVFLFLIEVTILVWVKFWEMGLPNGEPGRKAALASTMILIPAILVFLIFAYHFYRQLVSHKYQRFREGIEQLESVATFLKPTKKHGDYKNTVLTI